MSTLESLVGSSMMRRLMGLLAEVPDAGVVVLDREHRIVWGALAPSLDDCATWPDPRVEVSLRRLLDDTEHTRLESVTAAAFEGQTVRHSGEIRSSDGRRRRAASVFWPNPTKDLLVTVAVLQADPA